MKSINYLSDLKIIEKYPQDVASFVYHFTTDCSNKCYDVSLELGNCFKLVKDGEELLVITLDSHGLKEGQLKVRRELNYLDNDFPDKEYNKVTENLYDIYLVDGKSDEVEEIEVEGYIPVFRGYSAYEIAVQQGFVGTEAEWLKSLKGEKGDKGDDGEVTEEQLQEVTTKVLNAIQPTLDGKQDKFKYLTETEGFGVGVTYWGSEISSYLNVNEYGSSLMASNTGSGESRPIGSIGVTENGVEVNTYGDYKFTYNGKEISALDPTLYYTKNEANSLFTPYHEFTNVTDFLYNSKQPILVSGTNIKTINNESILGSGNITISEGKVKDVKVNDTSVLDEEGIANIDLNSYEKTTNKVTSVTASSTDTQYPSARAVNTRVQGVQNTAQQAASAAQTALINASKATSAVAELEKKVDELELFKFPNATIFGQPTIQQGQISNFTAENYLQFPFIVDFQNRPWQIDMAVTMGADVSGQHNILDSNFGLAFAIQNTKLVLALSYDGVAWAGAYTSSTSIEPNKTYYIKISWDGAIYKVDVSENKTTYTNFISVNSTNTLYPRTITIGKSIDNRYIWNGSINFNEAKLTISDKVVWTGMDDAGLSTRLAVNLNNIDSEGKKAINDIVNIGELGQQVALNTSNLDGVEGVVVTKIGSKNLLDKKTIQLYDDNHNWVIATTSSWRKSAPIEVEEGKTYSINHANMIYGYDVNLNYVINLNDDRTGWRAQTFTIPIGVRYVSIQRWLDDGTRTQLELGDTCTSYEEYVKPSIFVESTKYSNKVKFKPNCDDEDFLAFMSSRGENVIVKSSKNLLDPKTINIYQDDSRNWITYTSGYWSKSAPIKVKEGSTYSINISNIIWGYDEDLKYVKNLNNSSTGWRAQTFTIPEGITYVAFEFPHDVLTSLPKIQFEKGSSITTYEEYYKSFVDSTSSFEDVVFKPNTEDNDLLDLIDSKSGSSSYWRGKRMLAIGDSITAALQWQKVVGDLLGMNVRTHAKGGTSSLQQIDGDGSEPPTYYDPDTDASGNLYPLSVEDVKDVDLIIWHTFYNELYLTLGSVTDIYPTNNTVCGRLNYGIKRIFDLLNDANNLQCRVVIITPYCVGKYSWTDYDGYDIRENGVSVKELANTLVQCSNNNSLPCLNLWENLGANKFTWNYFGSSNTPYSNTYLTGDGHANDGTNRPFSSLSALPSASLNVNKTATVVGISGCYTSDGTTWVKKDQPAPWNADQLHCSSKGYERMGHVIATFVNML